MSSLPTLSSFLSSNQYTREVISTPFVAGMLAGSTAKGLCFGAEGATLDPGGLFGWLNYARSNTGLNPTGIVGNTSDTFILYSNPSDLVQDLNKLKGITNCLLSTTTSTGLSHTSQFSFFKEDGATNVVGNTNGIDFVHAINYMAYGGSLIIVGNTAGFDNYLANDLNNKIDVIIDTSARQDIIDWIKNQKYTIGVLPSSGTGTGYTLSSNLENAGSTNAMRYFSVYGTKTSSASKISTDSLKPSSQFSYSIPAVADVGGFFARAKNVNELYITVAGLDKSRVLNGNISNTIVWNSDLKSKLRKNKVNFFVAYNPIFLGSDLVGITAAASEAVLNYSDRVGPANLYTEIDKVINDIGLKYVFEINNSTTRAEVTSEVQTSLDRFATFLDTTKTQIICNDTNNINNSSTLNIQVIVKPIVSVENFVINFTYTNS